MKTLKLVRNSQGKLDIVNKNGRAVVLDSDNSQKEVGEQRVEKAIRSRRNLFDPRYGVESEKYIGTNGDSFGLLTQDVIRQERFFVATSGKSGTAAITRLSVEQKRESNGSIFFLLVAKMPDRKITVRV